MEIQKSMRLKIPTNRATLRRQDTIQFSLVKKSKNKELIKQFYFWKRLITTKPDIFTHDQKNKLKQKLEQIPQVHRQAQIFGSAIYYEIIRNMTYTTIKDNQPIMKKGEIDDNFYVLLHGNTMIKQTGSDKSDLSSFNESYTDSSSSSTLYVGVQRPTQNILLTYPKTLKRFGSGAHHNKSRRRQQRIKRKSSQLNFEYIIEKNKIPSSNRFGSGSVSKRVTLINRSYTQQFAAPPKDYYGNLYPIKNYQPNNETILASGSVFVCKLKGSKFRQMTKGITTNLELKQIIKKFEDFDFLRSLSYFELVYIILKMGKDINSQNTTIFKEGDAANYVYFILHGRYRFLKTVDFNSEETIKKLGQQSMLMYFNKNKNLTKHNSKEITLATYEKGDLFGYEDVILKQPRFSKCLCTVANSCIWKMEKEEFKFYVYNTRTWKQAIDTSVLTYQNYLNVKMSTIQELSFENRHLLKQVREIRGKQDWVKQKSVEYPRNFTNKQLPSHADHFLTQKMGNHVYNKTFKKVRQQYELQEKKDRVRQKYKKAKEEKQEQERSQTHMEKREEVEDEEAANHAFSRVSRSVMYNKYLSIDYVQKQNLIEDINNRRNQPHQRALRTGSYYLAQLIGSQAYTIDPKEISQHEVRRLIRKKNKIVKIQNDNKAAKKELKKKLIKNDLSSNAQIEKAVMPLKNMLRQIYQLENISKVGLMVPGRNKAVKRKGTQSITKIMPQLVNKRRPFTVMKRPRVNLINRQIFQNIHEGTGFYSFGTKIKNCRFQPDYKKLIVDKANRRATHHMPRRRKRNMTSNTDMNRTMDIRSRQAISTLNDTVNSNEFVNFEVQEQQNPNLKSLLKKADSYKPKIGQKRIKYKKSRKKNRKKGSAQKNNTFAQSFTLTGSDLMTTALTTQNGSLMK